MADSQYQILGRNDRGGLKQSAAEQLKEVGVKVDLSLTSSRMSAGSAGILREFNNLLPKNVIFPRESPFLILRVPARRPGGNVAECKCECGATGSCSGGGGGK